MLCMLPTPFHCCCCCCCCTHCTALLQGNVLPEDAARVAGALHEMGCYEVSMGDTIGVGTPASGAMHAALRQQGRGWASSRIHSLRWCRWWHCLWRKQHQPFQWGTALACLSDTTTRPPSSPCSGGHV
jgi:hypothetical protein